MRIICIVMALFVLLGAVHQTPAQRPTEYEVKAAFLYNFARFATWPETAFAKPDSPLVIGLWGPDPFGTSLENTIRDKTANGRPLKIRRFSQADDIQGCHVLFIPSSEFRYWAALQTHLEGVPVLTIGEVDGFCETGGMINFILKQNRVRFEINIEAIERTKLEISSRLLRLAENLKTIPREER